MFAISANDLPRICSYEDAKRIYGEITPIRGSHDLRPLGKRSAQHKRIEKTYVDGVEVYEAVLHGTACLRWYPDGSIWVNHGGWESQSTAIFIDAVLPWGSCSQKFNWLNLSVFEGTYPIPRDGLMLDTVNRKVLNPPKMFVQRFDKQETKRIRGIAKPIYEYFKAMNAMNAMIGKVPYEYWINDTTRDARRRLNEFEYGGPNTPFAVALTAIKQSNDISAEMLSDVFWCRHGVFDWEAMYLQALIAKVTTSDKLYINDPLPEGVIKQGMQMETGQ